MIALNKSGMSFVSSGLLSGLIGSVLVHVALAAYHGPEPEILISFVMLTPPAVLFGFFFSRAVLKKAVASGDSGEKG